ncbi:hypothetical protein [Massilia putida]|uniref:hypothetical protein n=1 Tax=Massilia putida TaxID=1141883 RepID=UPI0012EBD08D|nr:hypothetical protein [Massilia putida]
MAAPHRRPANRVRHVLPLAERALEIPPALTIVMQLVSGSLFDVAGIAPATSLAAVPMVLVDKP